MSPVNRRGRGGPRGRAAQFLSRKTELKIRVPRERAGEVACRELKPTRFGMKRAPARSARNPKNSRLADLPSPPSVKSRGSRHGVSLRRQPEACRPSIPGTGTVAFCKRGAGGQPMGTHNRHRGRGIASVPCHTTQHAGPHRAVRRVEVTRPAGGCPVGRSNGWGRQRG